MSKGWTLAGMPRQDGRRAIVTGGNSGIGFYAALELARHGAAVVIAARSRAKAEAAALEIGKEVPGAAVDVQLLDLASLASVRSFATEELARPEPLDILLNNAGVMAPPHRQTTADGFELQFGTNVVGHFALTGLLLPKLEQRARQVGETGGLVAGEREAPRIVTIASLAHRRGRLHFDDLQWERTYSPMGAYHQSKLADLMFAFELDRRLRAHHSGVLSLAAHPGLANTNLFQNGNYGSLERRGRALLGHLLETLFNSGAQGAIPTLFAAAAPDAVSGGYYGPQSLFETRGGNAGNAHAAPQALDLADAAHLWQVCEELSGVRYL